MVKPFSPLANCEFKYLGFFFQFGIQLTNMLKTGTKQATEMTDRQIGI